MLHNNTMKILLSTLLYFTLFSCNSSDVEIERPSSSYEKVESSNDYNNSATELHQEEPEPEINSEAYSDNTYAADVEYYNPNTGRRSFYSLDVDVVDNIVTVIHFSNGGWLDETHIISGGELDENGRTTIESDKGYYYTVTISRQTQK